MATYLITYDLIGKEPSESESYDKYEDLVKAIKSYAPYLKVQFSEWLVKTDKGPKEIFDELVLHLRPDDRLLILNVTPGSWWGRGAIDGGTDALANFLRS